MKCGLLGRSLGHSYSPQIHSFLGAYEYSIFQREPEDVEGFLRQEAFDGINVTIPYKKTVIPFLNELSPIASNLGAVNTIVRRGDGSLIGHNTDYFGFRSMVARSGLTVNGKKVLVLGTGGASLTVQAVLRELGAQVVVISRSGSDNYSNLERHADTAVIVNATPVGMYPHVEEAPLSLDGFPKLEGVLDLIYNPARTQLLLEAENRGLTAMNGLWMLVAQAWESAQWFLGKELDECLIEMIYRKLRGQMENIVLIGMPGCGKSTVAKILARELGRQLKDADSCIVQEAGCSIPEIFDAQGESGFRELETAVLDRLGRESGLVIATGGGCVTRPENYPLLRRNSRIIWLERDLEKLPTQGRPLSQKNKLTDMYAVRKPLYERFGDLRVSNHGTPEQAAQQIMEALK